ncbi:MAG: hypothetical protein H0U97_14545 [Gammaproteobacteria bacterium]|nr:hypothetical protein [Gammaproteobacteria bacterium]
MRRPISSATEGRRDALCARDPGPAAGGEPRRGRALLCRRRDALCEHLVAHGRERADQGGLRGGAQEEHGGKRRGAKATQGSLVIHCGPPVECSTLPRWRGRCGTKLAYPRGTVL